MTTQPPNLVARARVGRLRDPLPRGLKERDFQRLVLDLAGVMGWWVYHPYDSRRSREGWPDLTLIRGTRILFLELKTDRGRVRTEQLDVLTRLTTAGQQARIVRPGDWPWIVDTLTGGDQ